MPKSALKSLAVADRQSALSARRATAFLTLRHSAKGPLSRSLHPRAAAALAQPPGMLILFFCVDDPSLLYDDDVGLPLQPFDGQFHSPRHDLERLLLLVVVLLRFFRHSVERLFPLVADAQLQLSHSLDDANLRAATDESSLLPGVVDLQPSHAACELLHFSATLAALTAILPAVVPT